MMSDRIGIAHAHQIPLLSRVIGKVSAWALTAAKKQIDKSNGNQHLTLHKYLHDNDGQEKKSCDSNAL
jgi:hypothetical protein